MCNYLVGKNADVRWRWPTRTRRWTWKASWWQNRRRRKGQKDDDGFYLHVLRPKGKICKCVLFIRGKTSKYCVHEDLSATQPTDDILLPFHILFGHIFLPAHTRIKIEKSCFVVRQRTQQWLQCFLPYANNTNTKPDDIEFVRSAVYANVNYADRTELRTWFIYSWGMKFVFCTFLCSLQTETKNTRMELGAGSPSLAPPPTPFGARLPMRGRFVRMCVCTMYVSRHSQTHTQIQTHTTYHQMTLYILGLFKSSQKLIKEFNMKIQRKINKWLW